MSKNHIALAALAVVAGLSSSAFAEQTLSANIEFDNTWANNGVGVSQGGRVELNAIGKVSPNYFVAGKASFLAKRDGTTATDDMWVQMGSQTADLKLGRFEATELYALGRDTLVDHAGGGGSVYLANTLRGRTGTVSNGTSPFHGAFNYKLTPELTAEVGLVETRAADASKGLRPVITYATGPLQLRAGVEVIRYVAGPVNGDASRETGVGLTGKYNFGAFALNANFASGKDAFGNKHQTAGLTVSDSALGGGLIFARNDNPGAAEDYKVTTGYVTYAMPLFDIKGATLTTALLASRGSGSNTAADLNAVRVRINYAF